MASPNELSPSADLPALDQIGALPVRFENGQMEILLLTSRETRRWVIPKGWPMKGLKDWAAAAREAKEEAGIIGKIRKKPIGSFYYFKRQTAHFDLCRVEVYLLEYEKRLADYREKGQREARWFLVDEAAVQVIEPGLIALLRGLDIVMLRKSARKHAERKESDTKRRKS